MPEEIPVEAASMVANQYGCSQVIVFAWDGKTTHVVTYGKSIEDSAQAAAGGNRLKRALGWPEKMCQSVPVRIKRMRERIAELEEELRNTERREEK